MEKQRIKNQIRRLRFEANELTQVELAEKASVTRQTIIALEAQKYSPSLELAFRIAKVFDVPLEEAFQYNKTNQQCGATLLLQMIFHKVFY